MKAPEPAQMKNKAILSKGFRQIASIPINEIEYIGAVVDGGIVVKTATETHYCDQIKFE